MCEQGFAVPRFRCRLPRRDVQQACDDFPRRPWTAYSKSRVLQMLSLLAAQNKLHGEKERTKMIPR